MTKIKFLLVFILFLVRDGFAQQFASYQKMFITAGKDTLPYRILYPRNFNPQKKYPVIIFLHGSGERGNDNENQLAHAGGLFLKDSVRERFPAIVVFPQCSESSYWSNVRITTDSTGKEFFKFKNGGKPTSAMFLLLGLVSKLENEAFVDPARFYAAGLSMGGMGTYELLRRKPYLFAAAFVICGADNVANAKKYKDIPLWIFQGAKDDVVDPQYARNISRELERLGSPVKLMLYPNANHNSWDAALAEPNLLPWLFSNSKKNK